MKVEKTNKSKKRRLNYTFIYRFADSLMYLELVILAGLISALLYCLSDTLIAFLKSITKEHIIIVLTASAVFQVYAIRKQNLFINNPILLCSNIYMELDGTSGKEVLTFTIDNKGPSPAYDVKCQIFYANTINVEKKDKLYESLTYCPVCIPQNHGNSMKLPLDIPGAIYFKITFWYRNKISRKKITESYWLEVRGVPLIGKPIGLVYSNREKRRQFGDERDYSVVKTTIDT